jgi:hypothetical protein
LSKQANLQKQQLKRCLSPQEDEDEEDEEQHKKPKVNLILLHR